VVYSLKYVLATANSGKVKEMQDILSKLDIEVISRKDLGIEVDIEETGMTFFENAKLKAEAICKLTSMPSIADDSGLMVDALDGKPGVFSSSFGGDELTDVERCNYLLDLMKDKKDRRAKFICTIVCAFPDGDLLTATGECAGTITEELKGMGGFGYDPIFKPVGKDKTMAELSSDEKNNISHRAIALRAFSGLLTIGQNV
jgi:XTP/dITP diphosphohydrolase